MGTKCRSDGAGSRSGPLAHLPRAIGSLVLRPACVESVEDQIKAIEVRRSVDQRLSCFVGTESRSRTGSLRNPIAGPIRRWE
jgi:hypothetical protein